MILFEEFIEALGENKITILTEEGTRELVKEVFDRFRFNSANRLDKTVYPDLIECDIIDFIRSLNSEEATVFVIWDDYEVPAIKSMLNIIADKLEDVTAVAFNTWVVHSTFDWLIEVVESNGRIRIIHSS